MTATHYKSKSNAISSDLWELFVLKILSKRIYHVKGYDEMAELEWHSILTVCDNNKCTHLLYQEQYVSDESLSIWYVLCTQVHTFCILLISISILTIISLFSLENVPHSNDMFAITWHEGYMSSKSEKNLYALRVRLCKSNPWPKLT